MIKKNPKTIKNPSPDRHEGPNGQSPGHPGATVVGTWIRGTALPCPRDISAAIAPRGARGSRGAVSEPLTLHQGWPLVVSHGKSAVPKPGCGGAALGAKGDVIIGM